MSLLVKVDHVNVWFPLSYKVGRGQELDFVTEPCDHDLFLNPANSFWCLNKPNNDFVFKMSIISQLMVNLKMLLCQGLTFTQDSRSSCLTVFTHWSAVICFLCGLCHTTWLPEVFVPGSFMAEQVLTYHGTVEKDSFKLSCEEKQ